MHRGSSYIISFSHPYLYVFTHARARPAPPHNHLYLPAVVALAGRTAAERALPDDVGRLIVLVNSMEVPVLVVVAVVVAVSGGYVSTIQGVLGKVSVAGVRDGLVRVHGRGVGPEGVDGIVAKHALFGRRVRPRVSDNRRCARESCACRQLSTNIIRAPAGGQRHVGQAGDVGQAGKCKRRWRGLEGEVVLTRPPATKSSPVPLGPSNPSVFR